MTRLFSDGMSAPPARTIDDDAPIPMRIEYGDALFALVERYSQMYTDVPSPGRVHQVIANVLGQQVASAGSGGRSAGIQLLIDAPWPRFYDLVLRFAHDLDGYLEPYRYSVNKIFAAHGVVWDLSPTRTLERVEPVEVQRMVGAAFDELNDPLFEGGRAHLVAAIEAFNERPRRDREACADAFDALEAVAKARYELPNGKLDDAIKEARSRGDITAEVAKAVSAINVVRHNHFGHGTTTPFGLRGSEVDFVYLSCLSGILLFARRG